MGTVHVLVAAFSLPAPGYIFHIADVLGSRAFPLQLFARARDVKRPMSQGSAEERRAAFSELLLYTGEKTTDCSPLRALGLVYSDPSSGGTVGVFRPSLSARS